MSKPSRKSSEDPGVVDGTRSGRPAGVQDARAPGEPPRDDDETPDDAVEGRDRLSENEHRPMEPGVTGSSGS